MGWKYLTRRLPSSLRLVELANKESRWEGSCIGYRRRSAPMRRHASTYLHVARKETFLSISQAKHEQMNGSWQIESHDDEFQHRKFNIKLFKFMLRKNLPVRFYPLTFLLFTYIYIFYDDFIVTRNVIISNIKKEEKYPDLNAISCHQKRQVIITDRTSPSRLARISANWLKPAWSCFRGI